jgi:hypothetical protein
VNRRLLVAAVRNEGLLFEDTLLPQVVRSDDPRSAETPVVTERAVRAEEEGNPAANVARAADIDHLVATDNCVDAARRIWLLAVDLDRPELLHTHIASIAARESTQGCASVPDDT